MTPIAAYTLVVPPFTGVADTAVSSDALWFELTGQAPSVRLVPAAASMPSVPAFVVSACLSAVIAGFPDPLPFVPLAPSGGRVADPWLASNNQKM